MGDEATRMYAVLRGEPATVTVPREPTRAMLDAARDWSAAKYGRPIGHDAACGCWAAMLEAAVLRAADDELRVG